MIATIEKQTPVVMTMASWPNIANDIQWVLTHFSMMLENPHLWKFSQIDSTYIYDGELVGGLLSVAWLYYTKGIVGVYGWIRFIEEEDQEDG